METGSARQQNRPAGDCMRRRLLNAVANPVRSSSHLTNFITVSNYIGLKGIVISICRALKDASDGFLFRGAQLEILELDEDLSGLVDSRFERVEIARRLRIFGNDAFAVEIEDVAVTRTVE